MVPENLKKIFGLTDKKDVSMANNIWKMLDDMAESDPESYKNFVQKNLNQGLTDMKAEKQKKQKPFKVIPKEGLVLEMDATLNEKVLEERSEINEKLDLNKVKFSDVKAKFPSKVRLFLNVCYSQRVKEVELKGKGEKKEFSITSIKDIESLYYSLQGPFRQSNGQEILYYCIIFNEKFYHSFERVQGGKKILLSIAVSYFQERLQTDRNPLTKDFNPELYGKLLFYGIQKMSIEINEAKFKYGKEKIPSEFLLEKQVDIKERGVKKEEKKTEVQVPKSKDQLPTIKIRQEEEKKSQQPLPQLIPTDKSKKKPLIQVIEEKPKEEMNSIPYEMKETQDGYHIQFLVPSANSINDLDLQVNKNMLKLKVEEKELKIELKKSINSDKVKAKLKKKMQKLLVDLFVI